MAKLKTPYDMMDDGGAYGAATSGDTGHTNDVTAPDMSTWGDPGGKGTTELPYDGPVFQEGVGQQAGAGGGQQQSSQVGHDGVYNGENREQWRDDWMGAGQMSAADMDKWMSSHGATKTGDNGTFVTPFGEQLDLGKNYKSGNVTPAFTASAGMMGADSGIAKASQTGLGENGGGYTGGTELPKVGGGTAAASTGLGFGDDLKNALKGLFPGGMFNQDVVNTRTQGARENLERFRKSQSQGDNAVLAARGLMGSGAEQTAQNRLSSNIADQYGTQVNDIYANESQNADSRMAKALELATGMSIADAENSIAQYRAQNDLELGRGQLALGNRTADQNYSLGQGRLALDRTNGDRSYDLGLRSDDLGRADLEERARMGDINAQIELLRINAGNADTSAGGHR